MLYLDSSKFKKVTIREVIERYKDGLSIEQIADEYDVDDVKVVNRLKDYENIFGINIIKRIWRYRRADLDLAANDMVEEYKEGTVLA